ncbi:MAG: DUF559 domain-containing protein [Clostridia bacterium]|nr:DUF559 domain-containing protein [Clostridia bacterium]
MTDEEKHLWYDFLKKLPVSVYRQKVIGNYIVDFCIPKHKVVIELDGSQHGRRENKAADEQRDFYLSSFGFTVLRYTNEEIRKQFDSVCGDILLKLQ